MIPMDKLLPWELNQDLKENWVELSEGTKFYPFDPSPEMVKIEEIAHSLSGQVRFNGHIIPSYTVAQHSVWCSRIVPAGFELEALLHDATEMIIGDIPSPVKEGLPFLKGLENMIWREAIAPAFGLPEKISPEVKHADFQMLLLEKQQLCEKHGNDWGLPAMPLPDIKLLSLSRAESKELFLSRFRELTEE